MRRGHRGLHLRKKFKKRAPKNSLSLLLAHSGNYARMVRFLGMSLYRVGLIEGKDLELELEAYYNEKLDEAIQPYNLSHLNGNFQPKTWKLDENSNYTKKTLKDFFNDR